LAAALIFKFNSQAKAKIYRNVPRSNAIGGWIVKPRTRKFKQEYAQKLLKIAKDDLFAAQFLFTEPTCCRPETIGYHVQQSAEKSLKSVMIHLKMEIPMIYDIDGLLRLLPSNLTQNFPEGAGELTQFATLKRYIDGASIWFR
jgi:HEPN domain-containing protein